MNSQLIKSGNAEKVKAVRESVDFHKLSRKGTVVFEHGAENSTQIWKGNMNCFSTLGAELAGAASESLADHTFTALYSIFRKPRAHVPRCWHIAARQQTSSNLLG